MNRYLNEHILQDLKKKMVFITGPRQVGKTYLAKSLQSFFPSFEYLNYDDIDDIKIIHNRSWPQNKKLVILDEIHKMKGWKQYVKGTYDTKPEHQTMLITGSARLETFRQVGESLAGRYFHYRLNPFSVRELQGREDPYDLVNKLNNLGGFPEPFLSGSQQESDRWRRQYYTDLVREDILDFSKIQEIRTMRILLDLLRKRVSLPISYTSLAEDLQVSPNTVRKYISILESLYVIFLVRPFHKNIARAILREPKIYFYDSGYVNMSEGVRLENTVAVCLLKHVQYLQDTQGKEVDLCYLRTKQGKEIDFVILKEGVLSEAVEVKLSEKEVSPALRYFKERFPQVEMVQLVHNLRTEREQDGILVAKTGNWLVQLAA